MALEWPNIKYIQQWLFFASSVTSAPFVREMPAFLHNFILRVLPLECWAYHAFACSDLCARQGRLADWLTSLTERLTPVSPSQTPSQSHCYSEIDGREQSNVCTARFNHVYVLKVQIKCMRWVAILILYNFVGSTWAIMVNILNKSVHLLFLGDFAVFVQVRTAIYTKSSIANK